MPAAPPLPTADAALYCPRCDYDLRGLEDVAECPECGQGVDVESLRREAVPWEARRRVGRLGRVQTFWQTVWRVSAHPRRFALARALPVDHAAAIWFRRVLCGWLVVHTVLAAAAAVGWLDGWDDAWRMVQASPTDAVVLAGAVLSGLWLFLMGITGVHSYWFHPRNLHPDLQDRAVSLSLYAAAPLALAPLAWLPLLAAWGVAWATGYVLGAHSGVAEWVVFALLAVGVALVPGAVASAWITIVRLADRLAFRGVWGRLSLLAALPILWALLFLIAAVAVPVLLFYIWLLLPLI